jgi:EF-P beta-lysylation protein EpmB
MTWQKELAQGFKNPNELLRYLELSPEMMNISEAAHKAFKTLVPKNFVEKMVSGDPHDPLLRQVLPISDEMQELKDYIPDPLQESAEKQQRPLPGLLHKYSSRVLLTLTGGCAVNCRYCFRRHFDYQSNRIQKEELANIIDYIQSRPEIQEVILSGGDPLLLNDDLLKAIITAIENIPSIKILRFHTRMPIVLPSRITAEFAALLKNTRLHTVLVVHANHPNELDNTLGDRLALLRSAGTHLLNQSVLLKGVNDNVKTLCQLSYGLLDMGILPYYLHLLDKVQGAAHFDIEEKEALTLHQAMREQLPGYLLPKLVREVPGELSKMPVF